MNKEKSFYLEQPFGILSE